MHTEPRRIAVIGCGVAGLTAAHLLQRQHRVTILERNDALGGHTHTVPIPDGPDAGTPVDTGFIVCNDHTYPLFLKLLAQLGVEVRNSDMSFSYHDEGSGFHYAGTGLNGLFAQRSNLVRPSFWRMLHDTRRFCATGLEALRVGNLPQISIGEFVTREGYSSAFTNWYLVPMMAAIWSTSPTEVYAFPAEALLRFFKNHGLLSLKDRPQWMTVAGGSHAYVDAFEAQFGGEIRTSCPVAQIRRTSEGVAVTGPDGKEESFDCAVVAAHADEAFAMLADPSEEERRLLGPWRYQRNDVVLHTDPTALPPTRRAWASWNYAREAGGVEDTPVSVSYYMNRLQGLTTKEHYVVSLNRRCPVPEKRVVKRIVYMHPTYSFETMDTQSQLSTLNGQRNTYFCGSYFGYGFHEDAVRSAVGVAAAFGIEL